MSPQNMLLRMIGAEQWVEDASEEPRVGELRLVDDAAVVDLASAREEAHRLLGELDRVLGGITDVTRGRLLPAVADDMSHDLLAAAERVGAALERLSVGGYLEWADHAVTRSEDRAACPDRVRETARAVRAAGRALGEQARFARAEIEDAGLVRPGWTVHVAATGGARLEDRVHAVRRGA